ncbi:MAG TPA: response regulator transcription factor [Syntrophorhabdaceae bacterium]|nr:response regulator transcription factor [Syntrophorhabdaceae bacterium]HQE81026.1 response regulator transcription factor [Syntrophorhabdaceae bacterium]HRV22905.1 response regulator transcription factor [Syntrophorhabdaceae bacterium]
MIYNISMRLLLIEDEEKVANFISLGLKEEGYEVDTAYDGKKGLELIRENSYGAILLDLMIPEIDGLELLKTIRSWGVDTPVLIITAKNSKEDVVRGLDTGSDDYLTKPFSFEELLARIRALLRRSMKSDIKTLEYRGLTLNPYTRRLHSGSGETDLTEKEFLIMELMLKNKESVLSRKDIAEYVWHSTADTTNIVDVYVNFLRKKIEALTSKKYIHTVRGMGYILKEDEKA